MEQFAILSVLFSLFLCFLLTNVCITNRNKSKTGLLKLQSQAPPANFEPICKDVPELVIQGARRVGNHFTIKFEYGGQLYTSKAAVNTSDVSSLPMPLEVPSEMTSKTEMIAPNPHYFFDSVRKAFILKERNMHWRLAGFNQVWLGCPQPLCFCGWLDAAVYEASTNRLTFFRGNYMWNGTRDTILHTSRTLVTNPVFQNVDAVDFSSYLNAFIVIKGHNAFKVNDLGRRTGDRIAQVDKNKDFGEYDFTGKVDAIAFHQTEDMFTFKSYQVQISPKRGTSATRNHAFADVDAAFVIDDIVHIIADWNVYRYNYNNDPPQNNRAPSSTIAEFVHGCADQLYAQAGFESKSHYLSVIAPKVYSHSPLFWTNDTAEIGPAKRRRRRKNLWPMIISGIAFYYTVTFIGMVYYAISERKKEAKRKLGSQSADSRSVRTIESTSQERSQRRR